MKWVCNTQSRPNQDELAARITFLDKVGKPHGGYTQCLVDLRRVIEYIYKHNSTKGRSIFSQIKKQSIGPQFQSTEASFDTRPFSLTPVTGATLNSVTENNQPIYQERYSHAPMLSALNFTQKKTVTVLNVLPDSADRKNASLKYDAPMEHCIQKQNILHSVVNTNAQDHSKSSNLTATNTINFTPPENSH